VGRPAELSEEYRLNDQSLRVEHDGTHEAVVDPVTFE
jgi:hypothetical protein